MVKRELYLTESELEIMLYMWRNESAKNSTEILNGTSKRSWNLSTLMSVLSTLTKKGYLHCDKSYRRNIYTVNVTEIEHTVRVFLSLHKIHPMSFSDIIKELYEKNIISREDLLEYRLCLDNLI